MVKTLDAELRCHVYCTKQRMDFKCIKCDHCDIGNIQGAIAC